jgi:hypothetical protein
MPAPHESVDLVLATLKMHVDNDALDDNAFRKLARASLVGIPATGLISAKAIPSPQELDTAIKSAIPAYVLESFLAVIQRNFNGHAAHFPESEVVREVMSRATAEGLQGVTSAMFYQLSWFRVTDHFKAAGWDTERDVPGYNEDYETRWSFTRPRR